ncbi:MAG: glycosyltransferase [Sedimentisphaerales bacterium]|nr:glycosyltransferase [Sedimentisphaerales bacterium]
MPAVSICVPTYNRKKYLRETLASVFAQTCKDYEVIIVDDGSTDGTDEMIKNSGYKTRYYWHKNQGEAAACNKLIELARGKYISFIHSDDILVSDAVERMLNAMESHGGNVVVYGNYFRIDEDGNVCGRSKRKLHSGYIAERLFEDVIVHPNGSMFPKKALEEAGGFDTSLKASYDYKLELAISLKYRFIALSEPTFMRRRHSSNTSKDSFANCKAELDMLTDFYYNGGGKHVISPRIAMKRFSRECYRAGRCAAGEGFYDQARELLGQSFRLRPSLKSLILLTKAVIARRLYPGVEGCLKKNAD